MSKSTPVTTSSFHVQCSMILSQRWPTGQTVQLPPRTRCRFGCGAVFSIRAHLQEHEETGVCPKQGTFMEMLRSQNITLADIDEYGNELRPRTRPHANDPWVERIHRQAARNRARWLDPTRSHEPLSPLRDPGLPATSLSPSRSRSRTPPRSQSAPSDSEFLSQVRRSRVRGEGGPGTTTTTTTTQ